MTDTELWERIKKGDKVGFEALYRRYYSVLFAYAVRMGFDEETVKDALQDIFLRLYTCRRRLPEVVHVKPYLYRSLVNALLDAAKSARNRDFPIEEGMDIPLEDGELAALFERNDADLKLFRQLESAFNQLSHRQKNALYLRFVQNFSWEELADMYGISVHSCMNLVGRAVARLKKLMGFN